MDSAESLGRQWIHGTVLNPWNNDGSKVQWWIEGTEMDPEYHDGSMELRWIDGRPTMMNSKHCDGWTHGATIVQRYCDRSIVPHVVPWWSMDPWFRDVSIVALWIHGTSMDPSYSVHGAEADALYHYWSRVPWWIHGAEMDPNRHDRSMVAWWMYGTKMETWYHDIHPRHPRDT